MKRIGFRLHCLIAILAVILLLSGCKQTENTNTDQQLLGMDGEELEKESQQEFNEEFVKENEEVKEEEEEK